MPTPSHMGRGSPKAMLAKQFLLAPNRTLGQIECPGHSSDKFVVLSHGRHYHLIRCN